MTASPHSEPPARAPASPKGLLLATLVAAGGLVLSEWLFFVTKPSFLLTVPRTERLLALVTATSLVALVSIAVVAPLLAMGRARGVAGSFAFAARLPAAILFAVTALLTIDGTSVTLLRRGIRDALSPAGRLGYGILGIDKQGEEYRVTAIVPQAAAVDPHFGHAPVPASGAPR